MTDASTTTRVVRGAAYAVMAECLRIQASGRGRTSLARLFGRDPILPDARSWYRGALGELHVAKTVNSLGPGWSVLHSQGASTLVIGVAGALLISTRNHSGQRVQVVGDRMLVNGRRTEHIRDAREEAGRIADLIGMTVIPVIAVVDPAVLTLKQRADGVVVLASSQLGGYLGRRRARLTEAEAAESVATASATGDWSADVVDETLQHESRFLRLKGEVDAAFRRRAWWLCAAAVSLVAVVVALLLR